jgi:hypothetical protein
MPKRKVIPSISSYLYTKFVEFLTLGRSLIWISKFGRLKILKNQKRVGPTCQPQHPLKWLALFTRERVHDTMCGDAMVTVRRQWPPRHVVAALSSRKVERREVSPILPSSTHMPTITLLYRSLSPRLCNC